MRFDNLQDAARARGQEWEGAAGADLSLSFRGNEMAGELGEALERAVEMLMLGVSVGKACNTMKKLERSALGMVGTESTREQLGDELADVVITAHNAARDAGIDLDMATVRKFNRTSQKHGFATMLLPRRQ